MASNTESSDTANRAILEEWVSMEKSRSEQNEAFWQGVGKASKINRTGRYAPASKPFDTRSESAFATTKQFEKSLGGARGGTSLIFDCGNEAETMPEMVAYVPDGDDAGEEKKGVEESNGDAKGTEEKEKELDKNEEEVNGAKDDKDRDGNGEERDCAEDYKGKEEEDVERKKGDKCEVKKLYAGRNPYCDCCIEWEDDKPDRGDETAKEERDRYAVLYRLIPHGGDDEWKTHSIRINNPRLKICLAQVFKDYPGIDADDMTFKHPFAPFVHRWDRLLEMQKEETDRETADYIKLLRQLLEHELKEPFKAMKRFSETGLISFENMIYALVPGEIVTGSHEGEPCAGLLRRVDKHKTERGLEYVYNVEMVDADGERFGVLPVMWGLREWSGLLQMASLHHFPLRVHPDRGAFTKRLVERGRKFEKLHGQHFKAYRGTGTFEGDRGQPLQKPISGRVYIDAYAYYNLQDTVAPDLKHLNQLGTDPQFEKSEPSQTKGPETVTTLTDEHCLICMPRILGFSLQRKEFCQFYVSNILDIEWNLDVFRDLVLAQDEKELLLALAARERDKNQHSVEDAMYTKGRGTIMLLCGPPGVGKTLTAESVAEEVRRPLYRLGAGDLGISPSQVESRLKEALERCARWNAVLLIDEADVFLECRTTDSLERNELVSIFLRLLEYYDGIMVLTTNRTSNMDPAFESRIDITLAYEDLVRADRAKIWRNLLKGIPSKEVDIADEDVNTLAEMELNGRQISSAMKTGRILAWKESSPLNMRHLRVVLNLREKAKVLLSGSTRKCEQGANGV